MLLSENLVRRTESLKVMSENIVLALKESAVPTAQVAEASMQIEDTLRT
jgi:hypothetical protein